MATILNKTEEVLNQLQAEQKVTVMNTIQDMVIISGINKHMEEVARDYEIKDRKSQLSAATIVLAS